MSLLSDSIQDQNEQDRDRKLRKAINDAFNPLLRYFRKEAIKASPVAWAMACQGWIQSIDRVQDEGERFTAKRNRMVTLTKLTWEREN